MITLIFALQIFEEIEEVDQVNGAAVMACAQQQLGKKYVWGATGPNTFDCSGLVQYCYKKAGKSLARVAKDQCKGGSSVAESAAVAGDLVCFGNPAHHVGLFAKKGQMIAAPHTGDVVKRQSYSYAAHTFRHYQ